jgi:hypothetical protein
MQANSDSRRQYTADEWEGLLSGVERGDHQHVEMQLQDSVMEYFLSDGFQEAAAAFKAEALSGGTDAVANESAARNSQSEHATAIRTSIRAGDMDGALAIISSVCPPLIASGHACIRRLKQQKVAELVRCGNLESAVRTFEHVDIA